MGTGTRTSADAVAVLRRARHDDVEALHAIEQRSFSDPWSRFALASAVESPALIVTVACAPVAGDQKVVGYSVLGRAADECELLNLAVIEEMRCRGVGMILLERALSDAADAGARAMFLEVRASNEAAQQLYGKAGFEQVGRRRGYYRRPEEDGIVMRRTIADC